MVSVIGKCYGSLQEKLEKEKENLKHVEANLKKIIGRAVDSGRQVRIGQKRNSNFIEPPTINSNAELWKSAMDTTGSGRKSWGGRQSDFSSFERPERRHRALENFKSRDAREGPPAKRKSINNMEQPKTVFSRLSGPVREPSVDVTNKFIANRRHTISSQIVVTPVDIPSRSEALAVQRKDPNNKERNKRMFGALLGTLRKFKQDETKLKDREEKKALIEKKLEDQAIKEKQQMRHERECLFKERKLKYIEIRNIEQKLTRLKEQEEWEAIQRPLANFIRTETSPHLYYLPKVLNEDTKKLLAETKLFIKSMIEEKNKQVQEQVEEILKQGMDDHEMDEDQDQDLEDVYNQTEPPPNQAEAVAPQDSTVNTSGLDEFGRDISKRDAPAAVLALPVTSETSPEPKARSPVARKSESPPARDSGSPKRKSRKRPNSKSSRSSLPRYSDSSSSRSVTPARDRKKRDKSSKVVDLNKVKQEKDGENQKKRKLAEKESEGGSENEGKDVKPVIARKKHNSSSDSSNSEEEESDFDSDDYDANKQIKQEKLEGIKEEKEDERKEESAVGITDVVGHNGEAFPVDLNSISLPGE